MLILKELLQELVSRGGSDLHISAGAPPKVRLNAKLIDLDYQPLTGEDTKAVCYGVLNSDQIARFERDLELDFSFGLTDVGRFRTNVFVQRGAVSAVFRVIPNRIKTFAELGLPQKICEQLCNLPKGLILVTGATGSGKSTTLAALIDHINRSRNCHIVTIEDPIEFVHENKGCLLNQREVGPDTKGFRAALRSVLRQDPDVIMVGEMRDLETIESALTLSETGHLTLATLHTSDAVQTINRIVDVFPDHQQQQIRTQLSFVLQAVFCQQLVPTINGRGRALASEILLVNPAVRALVRDNKAHQIYSIIQTNRKLGMKTMNQGLAELYWANQISHEEALGHSSESDELDRLISSRNSAT
ncbi:MAG: type IV pilus twitching motility protein PilT [Planctomycetota bacterium]